MYSLSAPPTGYSAFKELTVCSNKLIGGGVIFDLGGVVPLWIGMGPHPKVWMTTANPEGSVVSVITDSKAALSNVDIKVSGREMTAHLNGQRLITAKLLAQRDSCAVTYLDLRAIGLNISGDETSLRVGTSNFSGNTFSGVGVMFGFGSGH